MFVPVFTIRCAIHRLGSTTTLLIISKVFNLGEYRRKVAPTYNNANFFSPNNEEGLKLREKVGPDRLL